MHSLLSGVYFLTFPTLTDTAGSFVSVRMPVNDHELLVSQCYVAFWADITDQKCIFGATGMMVLYPFILFSSLGGAVILCKSPSNERSLIDLLHLQDISQGSKVH